MTNDDCAHVDAARVDAARVDAARLVVSEQPAGDGVRLSLAGELRIADVELLADCADRLCGMPVRSIRVELSGLRAADEAGARTLAMACHCLSLHGRRVEVRGLRDELRRSLARLGLTLPEPGSEPARRVPDVRQAS